MHTQVTRPDLFKSYLNVMKDYLMTRYQFSEDKAERIIKERVKVTYKPKSVIYVKAVGRGQTTVVQSDLYDFLKQLKDKVVAPNGGVYYSTANLPSPVSEFLNFKKKERGTVKKKQLKALAAGEYVEALRFWYVQASIKILMNSLPGAYASEYSIFYDKCAYNTITSTGRTMVRRSSTTTEQFLGGEFAWWSEHELLNYIIVNLRHAPDDKTIETVMNKYHMKHISENELYEYYKYHFKKYTKKEDYLRVKDLVNKVRPMQRNFLFYYCNFRNIIWHNAEFFKPHIQHLLDPASYQPVEGTEDDVKNIPGDIKILVAVAFTTTLGGFSIDDIVKEHKEYIPILLGICKGIKERLDDMEDIFSTFCNTECDIPNIINRGQFSKRNTVVLQDTDSSMFTTKPWADWFHGSEKFYVDNESLGVNALCVYWLSNIVSYVMHRFSIKLGVTDPYMKTLMFKNEFLYPVFLLTNAKKTYASIVKVQEGSILNPPKVDIKGQSLRGSAKSTDVNKFIEDLLVDKILKPASKGQISAYELIAAVVRFENSMKKSLLSGEITYLNTESIKMDKDYKNPDQPILAGFRFWEDLMAKKYGSIMRPAKVVAFPCIYPSAEFFKTLEDKYPRFAGKLKVWINEHPKFPTKLIINPSLEKVPEEIIGLIDVKHLIELNVKPAYSILNQLNINCGSSTANMLFSDLYEEN